MLPRELQYQIARKLDIDTRRILGIYTKLKVPKNISANISSHLVLPMPDNASSVDKRLMYLQFPFYDCDMQEFYLTMLENDMENTEDPVMRMVMYKVASWFSKYEFKAPGIVVKAGIPDGCNTFHMTVKDTIKMDVPYIAYGINMESYEAVQ